MWLVKKDEMPFVNKELKEALNFQLSYMLYLTVLYTAASILMLIFIGIFLIPVAVAVQVIYLVFMIIGAVKVGKGESYRYPMIIRFIS